MDNLKTWNLLKDVPETALKPIQAGRLKGKSDINPQWRMQKITEVFGMCGIGWKYEVTERWTETDGNQIAIFVNINVFVKVNDEWSDAIPGNGGSMLLAQEKNGLHFSDEAYKMATTDALSVAFKALGVAAEIYLGNDKSKYTDSPQTTTQSKKQLLCPKCKKPLFENKKSDDYKYYCWVKKGGCGATFKNDKLETTPPLTQTYEELKKYRKQIGNVLMLLNDNSDEKAKAGLIKLGFKTWNDINTIAKAIEALETLKVHFMVDFGKYDFDRFLDSNELYENEPNDLPFNQ